MDMRLISSELMLIGISGSIFAEVCGKWGFGLIAGVSDDIMRALEG